MRKIYIDRILEYIMSEKKLDVKIYTTPNCSYCKMTKEFFKENKIQYKEIDVSDNIKVAQEMVKKTGQMGVPVIDVNGQLIIGFDKNALRKALNLKL